MANAADLSAASELSPERRKVMKEEIVGKLEGLATGATRRTPPSAQSCATGSSSSGMSRLNQNLWRPYLLGAIVAVCGRVCVAVCPLLLIL